MLIGGFIEGGAAFVLDSDTGELQQVPGSTMYIDASAASWRTDGRVAVLSPPPDQEAGPFLSIYQPETGGQGFTLTEISEVRLDTGATGIRRLAGYTITTPSSQSLSTEQRLTIHTDSADRGMWQANEGTTTATQLNSVPESWAQAIWVPDASGVLIEIPGPVLSARSDYAYVSAAGEAPFSLAGWLGQDRWIGDFHWVEP
jgi:hypothetical protein